MSLFPDRWRACSSAAAPPRSPAAPCSRWSRCPRWPVSAARATCSTRSRSSAKTSSTVEIEGKLAAVRSTDIGAPAVTEVEFKISLLAPEGSRP